MTGTSSSQGPNSERPRRPHARLPARRLVRVLGRGSGDGERWRRLGLARRPDASPIGPPNDAQNGMNRMDDTRQRPQAMSRAYRSEGFNRVTLRVEPGKVRALVNGFVIVEETDPDPTSPWLALNGRPRAGLLESLRAGRQARDPSRGPDQSGQPARRLVGHGLYPRPSRLPATAPRLGRPERSAQPRRPSTGPRETAEIRGRRIDDSASVLDVQSRLAYARPLIDGESVTYSFLHEPGRVEVHPSLGRLAFLIEKEGVRLHWMTDGPGLDPSGLKADNSVDEPSSRRGSAPIPASSRTPGTRPGSRSPGGTVRLELNGEVIFERPIAPTDDRTFGLFHFKDRTASRVRDVVLRGDWPEKFEAARLAGLTARSRPSSLTRPIAGPRTP